MKLCNLLSGVSLGVLTLAVATPPAGAQEALPTIDVGAARPVVSGTGAEGQGTSPGIASSAGPYGGAGPAQDPYNKSYVLQNASTGTKTDTPVMDTPLNVQSVSQQVLQDEQATTLSTALQNFSGVFVANGAANDTAFGSSGIFVRGFQTSTYYRDGFRVDASYSGSDTFSSRQLANVASVEVLKGPGAILYGLSDPGGVINLTTKEPLDRPYYAVQQQFSSLADYRTTIDATGPLNTDKSLLYRINMSYESNGAPFGYPVDLVNSRSLFVAPVVKWNIDGATWVKLEAEYNHYHSGTYYPFDPLFNGVPANIPSSTNYGASSPWLQTNLYAALTWSHQFDKDWSIKQQIAYNYVNNNYNVAVPYFLGSVGNSIPTVLSAGDNPFFGQTTYSTDVDITGHINTFGAEHTLLLGGDVFHTTGNSSLVVYNIFTINNPLLNPIPLGLQPFQCPCSPEAAAYTQDTAGLYLQDQIKLPYNFFLLTGARYQYIRQASWSGEAQYGLQPTAPLTGQALTPRFGLLWEAYPVVPGSTKCGMPV